MGYDYIRCEYALPGNPPEIAKDAVFQTKDLGEFYDDYVITLDGALTGPEGCSNLTGLVNFYTNNVVASGPGIYTRNGEDAVFVEYAAKFVDGKLIGIVEIENRSEKAARSDSPSLRRPTSLTAEQRAEINARRNESLLGKTMCVAYGGQISEPYLARVIVETPRDWVVVSDKNGTEIIGRWQRDRTFFDTFGDAERYNAERSADWESRRKQYEAEIAAK